MKTLRENGDQKKITTEDYLNFAKIFMQANLPDSANAYFNKAIQKELSRRFESAEEFQKELSEKFL